MDIPNQINQRLRELNADNLPSAVLSSIHKEVIEWEKELNAGAKQQLLARIEKRITKPFVAKHFTAEFRHRRLTPPPLEDGRI
jgi:hypothetical protein